MEGFFYYRKLARHPALTMFVFSLSVSLMYIPIWRLSTCVKEGRRVSSKQMEKPSVTAAKIRFLDDAACGSSLANHTIWDRLKRPWLSKSAPAGPGYYGFQRWDILLHRLASVWCSCGTHKMEPNWNLKDLSNMVLQLLCTFYIVYISRNSIFRPLDGCMKASIARRHDDLFGAPLTGAWCSSVYPTNTD